MNKYLDKVAELKKKDVTKNYKKFLKEFGLQPEDVWLGAGSAMSVHGLRDKTNDLDAEAGSEVFNKVEQMSGRRRQLYGKAQGYVQDGTHVISFPEYKLDLHLAKSMTDRDIVNGVQVHSLNEILRMKTSLNRPKDQADIEKIKQILHSRAMRDKDRNDELNGPSKYEKEMEKKKMEKKANRYLEKIAETIEPSNLSPEQLTQLFADFQKLSADSSSGKPGVHPFYGNVNLSQGKPGKREMRRTSEGDIIRPLSKEGNNADEYEFEFQRATPKGMG